MDDELGVRRFAVVLVAEAAADAQDARRELILAKRPAGGVHLVDALAAQVAAAVFPEPVPVVVEVLAMWLFHRRGAEPEVVADGLGHFADATGHFADRAATLVAKAANDLDL